MPCLLFLVVVRCGGESVTAVCDDFAYAFFLYPSIDFLSMLDVLCSRKLDSALVGYNCAPLAFRVDMG
jgi:hypothetical protein